MEKEIELEKPSIIAIILWILGVFLIIITVYGMLTWHGWIEDIKDTILILTAFSSGVTAIATGALIDMHTMRSRKRRLLNSR